MIGQDPTLSLILKPINNFKGPAAGFDPHVIPARIAQLVRAPDLAVGSILGLVNLTIN